jgi:hypothetical protein
MLAQDPSLASLVGQHNLGSETVIVKAVFHRFQHLRV